MKTPTTVLFDIGNVIASDYWEALWLTRNIGLADRLALPRKLVIKTCLHLWNKYSIMVSEETEYWREASKLLGVKIDEKVIFDATKNTIVPNIFARKAIIDFIGSGFHTGIISNNTSFWHPRQLLLAQVSDLFDSSLVFISCDYGVEKCAGEQDLFYYVALNVDPKEAVVIDDRLRNISFARQRGFRAFAYNRKVNPEIVEGQYRTTEFEPFDVNLILQSQ